MSDYLGRPRFVIHELEGYYKSRQYGGGSVGPGLSVSITDRAYCCQLVAQWRTEDFPHGGSHTNPQTRDTIRAKIRRLAAERCAELNARA